MSEQYWADAATKNCVWLLQMNLAGTDANASSGNYWTRNVYLTQREAKEHRDYENSKSSNNPWRIWGVPCEGQMVEYIGAHNEDFADDVEYISPFPSKKYSRVEVIAEKGNDYVSWSEHTVMEQDNGKTLKIFKTLPEVKTEPVDDGSWAAAEKEYEKHRAELSKELVRLLDGGEKKSITGATPSDEGSPTHEEIVNSKYRLTINEDD